MTKRAISITLALIMLLGVFAVSTAQAADIKILTTKTLKVGQKANVNLTDPNTGAKISSIWESTNPSIATVTATGEVTGKKAGTCTVTTLWNNKLYGVKVKVKAAAKKTTSAKKTSAYTKLANYLKKNGTKIINDSEAYYIKWYEDGYVLWANYDINNKYVNMFIGKPVENPKDIFDNEEGLYPTLYKSGKVLVQYFRKSPYSIYEKSYKKGTTVNTAKLKLKQKYGSKFTKANSRARTLSKAGMSLWNKFLKARVGLTVKKLGFVYKKSAAKKIALSKKSATVKVGKKLTLKLKNAKASKVKWSSSKKKVATVNKKGVVKAKKAGKATITAKYKSKKYKCAITVKKSGISVK